MKSRNILTKIISIPSSIGKSLLNLSSILPSIKNIMLIYKIKQDLSKNNDSNLNNQYDTTTDNTNIDISEQDKKRWLDYSKDMLQKSHHALLYLGLIFLWTVANIAFMFSKAPFWMFLLQFYFLGILSYYFLMCRYRSYQGKEYANMRTPIAFKPWFNQIFNKK